MTQLKVWLNWLNLAWLAWEWMRNTDSEDNLQIAEKENESFGTWIDCRFCVDLYKTDWWTLRIFRLEEHCLKSFTKSVLCFVSVVLKYRIVLFWLNYLSDSKKLFHKPYFLSRNACGRSDSSKIVYITTLSNIFFSKLTFQDFSPESGFVA